MATIHNTHLARHGDLVVHFVANGALALVHVVKHDGYCCLGDASLPLLVHQLLQVRHADLNEEGVMKEKQRL